MASALRRTPLDLAARLHEEPWRFEFHQAVRLLARMHADKQTIGRGDTPVGEHVRLRASHSPGFPPSDILQLDGAQEDQPASMTVSFMGVCTPGSFGSLPTPYVEVLWERTGRGDKKLVEFLDVFNHRFLSLYYRAWEKYRPAILHEGASDQQYTTFEVAALALAGVDCNSGALNAAVEQRRLLGHIGVMRRGALSALELQELLTTYFAVPVCIVQHQPRWCLMEDHDRSRLVGRGPQLGVDAVLGGMVEVAESSFRVRMGPLDWGQFRSFLRSGSRHDELVALVQRAVGPEMQFDLELRLTASERPPLALNTDGGCEARLGWSTWLGECRPSQECLDVIIDPAQPANSALRPEFEIQEA